MRQEVMLKTHMLFRPYCLLIRCTLNSLLKNVFSRARHNSCTYHQARDASWVPMQKSRIAHHTDPVIWLKGIGAWAQVHPPGPRKKFATVKK